MDNPSAAFDDGIPSPAALARTRRSAWRAAAYAVVLGCLAGVLMFWELGADALSGDEAQYALVVQNIKRTGDWIYVTPYPPTPYFQKPPLYFWLTAATYDLFGGPDERAYRAWSAAAGVGTVVLTGVLGAMLLSPEIGALAALLVMTNRAFLLVHGARSGTFDALVAFFLLAGIVVYWSAARSKWSWLGWAGVGLCAGLASLTKPFVGVPLVGLLAVHALFVERRVSLVRRLGGAALALLVLAAVAAPWYAAQWNRYPDFAAEMFGKNLVERFTEGVDDRQVERWYFYIAQLTRSSLPFALAIPAAAVAVAAWCRGANRSAHALLVLIGAGWVALFSLSASKAIHYVYPAFPAVAVMIADTALLIGSGIVARRNDPTVRARFGFAAGVTLTAAFAFQYARTMYLTIPAERSPYVPWELYKILSPAIRNGDARVILGGFPDLQTEWRNVLGLRARDCYYVERMREDHAAVFAHDGTELAKLLEPRAPALALLSPRIDAQRWVDELTRQQRTDDRFIDRHQGYVALGTDLRPLLEPTARPGETNSLVQIESAATPGAFRLTITPPIVGAVSITTRLRIEDVPPNAAVRFVYVLATDGGRKTVEDRVATTGVDRMLDVSTLLEPQLLSGPGPFHLTLTIRDARSAALPPARSTAEEVRVRFVPHVPAETHPRR